MSAYRVSACLLVALVLAAPTLVFSHLPMTDLPQHIAIVSMMQHLHDPAYDFARHYELHLSASPYLLPYGIALSVGHLLPLELAMRLTVFLSVLAIPLGLLALVVAARRSPEWALLGFPLAYNGTFFWGFINFNLSLGLGLVAIATIISSPFCRRHQVLLFVDSVALVFTHVYGLMLVVAFFVIYYFIGTGWSFVRLRALWMAPSVIGAIAWSLVTAHAQGYGESFYPTAGYRLALFMHSASGDYKDGAQWPLVVALLALVCLLLWRNRMFLRDPKSLLQRTFLVLAALDLLLFFTLPQATPTAKYILERHAVLLILLLVVAVIAEHLTSTIRVTIWICALAAALLTWTKFCLFDREARSFDKILSRLPARPRLLSLILDPHGEVLQTSPYIHYAALIQARLGGVISVSFPRLFWNLPVRMRENGNVPPTPIDFEWHPLYYQYRRFGWYYDYILLRASSGETIETSQQFPYRPVFVEPPWQLYERAQ